jgi:putative ABC transport system ATP-binding protein
VDRSHRRPADLIKKGPPELMPALLTEPTARTIIDQSLTEPVGDAIVSARGLIKRFGQTEALRGVDLDVQRGEVLAVMGPSGSGKSTLLHCLAGVVVPDAGTVTIGKMVVNHLNEAQRSELRLSSLGFVFQFGQLLPELTAIDNVMLPLLLQGTSRREATPAASVLLDRLDIGELANRIPSELSGGQAQRVAIARAMITHPSILFADEPTGSLDSLAAEQALTVLLDLVRERGTTVVLITHDPRTAAYADREVIVRDGRIATTPIGLQV